MTGDDFIKLSALARHIQESVLNRAAEAGTVLTHQQAAMIMYVAVDLALLAYTGNTKGEPE